MSHRANPRGKCRCEGSFIARTERASSRRRMKGSHECVEAERRAASSYTCGRWLWLDLVRGTSLRRFPVHLRGRGRRLADSRSNSLLACGLAGSARPRPLAASRPSFCSAALGAVLQNQQWRRLAAAASSMRRTVHGSCCTRRRTFVAVVSEGLLPSLLQVRTPTLRLPAETSVGAGGAAERRRSRAFAAIALRPSPTRLMSAPASAWRDRCTSTEVALDRTSWRGPPGGRGSVAKNDRRRYRIRHHEKVRRRAAARSQVRRARSSRSRDAAGGTNSSAPAGRRRRDCQRPHRQPRRCMKKRALIWRALSFLLRADAGLITSRRRHAMGHRRHRNQDRARIAALASSRSRVGQDRRRRVPIPPPPRRIPLAARLRRRSCSLSRLTSWVLLRRRSA